MKSPNASQIRHPILFRRSFFFFQAEDGIRDGHVTGVQTCALPIYLRLPLEDLRRELTALGLPEGDLVCTLAGLDGASETRARGLWEVESLNAAYRRRRIEIERS